MGEFGDIGMDLGVDLQAAVAQRIEEQKKRNFIDLEDLVRTTKFSKHNENINYYHHSLQINVMQQLGTQRILT